MGFDHYVVWGFKSHYHTHSHIHDGLYKALKFMGKDAHWLDSNDHPDWIQWHNTLFITNHDLAHELPVHPSCFYIIHGGIDHPVWQRFGGYHNNRMSWNVYINTHDPLKQSDSTNLMWLDDDMPFFIHEHHMNMRWATDLTPPEIEANKTQATAFNSESRDINYVGTRWHVNEKEWDAFAGACLEGGISFRHFGAGQVAPTYSWLGHSRVVSPEENMKLVQASLFAPAIVGSHHLTEGYAPCRIFKNISYGHFGVTNSAEVQRLFGGRLFLNTNPRELFFDAREHLRSIPVSEVHSLMDYVAEKHTYVRRWERIFKAVDMISNGDAQ